MIKLFWKLRRLLGYPTDMVVIVYMDRLENMTVDEQEKVRVRLKECFKTANILIVSSSENKVQIEFF